MYWLKMERKSKIEKIVKGTCPVCLDYTRFDYLGVQETLEKEPLAMYVCRSCASCLSYVNILKDEKEWQ